MKSVCLRYPLIRAFSCCASPSIPLPPIATSFDGIGPCPSLLQSTRLLVRLDGQSTWVGHTLFDAPSNRLPWVFNSLDTSPVGLGIGAAEVTNPFAYVWLFSHQTGHESRRWTSIPSTIFIAETRSYGTLLRQPTRFSSGNMFVLVGRLWLVASTPFFATVPPLCTLLGLLIIRLSV